MKTYLSFVSLCEVTLITIKHVICANRKTPGQRGCQPFIIIFIIARKYFRVNRNEYRAILGSIPVKYFKRTINPCWILSGNKLKSKKKKLYHFITHYLTAIKQSGFPLNRFSADSGSIRDVSMWMEVLGVRSRGASGLCCRLKVLSASRKGHRRRRAGATQVPPTALASTRLFSRCWSSPDGCVVCKTQRSHLAHPF